MAAKFFHAMCTYLEPYAVTGLTDNSSVARILSDAWGQDITAGDVARWRRQHRRLNAVVENALDRMQAEAQGVVGDAIRGGDVATAKWFLERRNTNYQPASKLNLSGRVEGLSDLLARRMSEEDLRAKGVLYDEDGKDDDDGQVYD